MVEVNIKSNQKKYDKTFFVSANKNKERKSSNVRTSLEWKPTYTFLIFFCKIYPILFCFPEVLKYPSELNETVTNKM